MLAAKSHLNFLISILGRLLPERIRHFALALAVAAEHLNRRLPGVIGYTHNPLTEKIGAEVEAR